MNILNDFGKSIASILKFGSKLNKEQREEIRNVVGELADELDRSIRLTQFYLEGIKNLKNKDEIIEYLRDGSNKLLHSYSEYKVCAGLYSLHDRFDQIFDSVKLSVSVGNIDKIHNLIDSLSNGERMIIDGQQTLLNSLREFADELDLTSSDDEPDLRKEIIVNLNIEHATLELHRNTIKTTMRQVFDNL